MSSKFCKRHRLSVCYRHSSNITRIASEWKSVFVLTLKNCFSRVMLFNEANEVPRIHHSEKMIKVFPSKKTFASFATPGGKIQRK